MKLSIIIVNYNGRNQIESCIFSVLHQKYKDFEIIVVDNGSKDNSVEVLNFMFGNKIKIVKNKQNLGFAKGNNVGIKASKGKFLLFLNPDTLMPDGFLEKVMLNIKSNIGMVSFKMLNQVPNLKTLSLITKIDSYGIRMPKNGLGRDVKNIDEIQNIATPCGACMLYRKKTLEDIKVNDEYFDEDFFMYCEDSDLGLRALSRGWKLLVDTENFIIHEHSAIVRKAPQYLQLLGHRNNILTVIKNYPHLLRHLPNIIFWQLATIGLYTIKMHPLLILRLKWDAIKLIPKMIEKRKIIQKRAIYDIEENLT